MMEIRAGFDIAFEIPRPTPMILMLTIHPFRLADLLTDHRIAFTPPIISHDYKDMFGNICTRILAPPGEIQIKSDFVMADSGLPDAVNPQVAQLLVERLPDDVLAYLVGSRYCDTQKLSDFAWSTFGAAPAGWRRVQAICDYVHDRIAFSYSHARSDRTASEAHDERTGVCRDYAHLAVTLCRCMNIPARYCTGYLGDIGVPRDPAPMDFSTWFEAYLDGGWYTFDARHNFPRIGRIVMARGRDAADVAISTNFGPAKLTRFNIVADEVKPVPIHESPATAAESGVSFALTAS
jgi:transglutaminase-like putative cysteine protease